MKRDRPLQLAETITMIQDDEPAPSEDEDDITDVPPISAKPVTDAKIKIGGTRGDGFFYLTFLAVGQGDCAIMATPEGKILMIDCGTNGTGGRRAETLARCREVVLKPRYMQDTTRVHALILTHPDKDHYYWIPQVFPEGVSFGSIYYSGSFAKYKTGKTARFLRRRCPSADRKHVYHYQDDDDLPVRTLGGDDVPVRTRPGQVDCLIGDAIRIVDEPHCKISILAAEVPQTHRNDKGDKVNTFSVVTLIEVFDDRILIVGDATFSTEAYLMARHPAKITDLSLLQVGHHGSVTTSSLPAFVAMTNPAQAVICSAERIETNHLPRREVVDRYLDLMEGRDDTVLEPELHKIYCWQPGSRGGATRRFHRRKLWTDVPLWSTGTGRFDYVPDKPESVD
ncbi:ComEC/Rec2 family competence protein [Actinocorallia herbida]|uniref:ComEC/Rec2 family competence protein n=1 Tax=Actinocorallia herbida TaxID=58109 RepID=UPI000F4CF66F|nr:hypothetical protein [Actinocorallia herbida]